MTTTTLTAVDAHAAAAKKTRQIADLLTKAEHEQQQLQDTPLDDLLDKPSGASELAAARARSAETVQIHREMLEAAQAAQLAAARAVVAEEADALTPKIDAARAKLDAWTAKETKLLAQLEEHAGATYKRYNPMDDYKVGTTVTFKTPKDAQLRNALKALETQQAALQAASRGEDPSAVCPAKDLPASLQPGGILASAYATDLAHREAARAADETAHAAEEERLLDDLERACKALGVKGVEPMEPQWRPDADRIARWRRDAGLGISIGAVDENDHQVKLGKLDDLEVVARVAGVDAANKVLAVI